MKTYIICCVLAQIILCVPKLDFLEKKFFFCLKNWGNGPKIGLFEFKEKFDQ